MAKQFRRPIISIRLNTRATLAGGVATLQDINRSSYFTSRQAVLENLLLLADDKESGFTLWLVSFAKSSGRRQTNLDS